MQVISGGQLLVGEKNIFLKLQLLLKMASCGNVPSRNMNLISGAGDSQLRIN